MSMIIIRTPKQYHYPYYSYIEQNEAVVLNIGDRWKWDWVSSMRFHSIMPCIFIIPPAKQSCWGVYWFSLGPSIRLSVRPSVCLSVRLSRILCPLCSAYISDWIHFIFIHLSNFRRCVVCIVLCKISKFEFLAIFFICNFHFVLFWLGIWCVWVIMGRR